MIPTLGSGSIKEYLKSKKVANDVAADVEETRVSSGNIQAIQSDILSELKAMTSLQEQLINFLTKGKLDNLEDRREAGQKGGGLFPALMMMGAGSMLKGGGGEGGGGGFRALGTAMQLGGGVMGATAGAGLIGRLLGVGKGGAPGATTGRMGRAIAGASAAGGAAKKFGGKLIKGGLLGGVIAVMANPVANVVEDFAGRSAGDFAAAGMTGAGIGLMLAGPYGALAGALIGLGVEGLGKMKTWADDHRNKISDELEKDLEVATKKQEELNAALPEGEAPVLTDEVVQEVLKIKQEQNRTAQLAVNQNDPEIIEQRKVEAKAVESAKTILEQQGDKLDFNQAAQIISAENSALGRDYINAGTEGKKEIMAKLPAVFERNVKMLLQIPDIDDRQIGMALSGGFGGATSLSSEATMFEMKDKITAIRSGARTIEDMEFGDEIAELQRINGQTAEEQARIDRSMAGENEYWGKEAKGIAKSQETINALKEKKAELVKIVPEYMLEAASLSPSLRIEAQAAISEGAPGAAGPGGTVVIDNSKTEVVPQAPPVIIEAPSTSVSTSDKNPAFRLRRN